MNPDKAALKYIYENGTSTIIFLITGAFIAGFAYNLGYFTGTGNLRYLTLLGFVDYVEYSAPFLFMVIILLLYSFIFNIDREGAIGQFIKARNDNEAINQERPPQPFKIYKYIYIVVFRTLNILINLAPLIIIGLLLFSACLHATSAPHMQADDLFDIALFVLLVIFPATLVSPWERYQSNQYVIRLLAFKILLIVLCLSFSTGIFQGVYDISTTAHRNDKRIFLRAVNKGAFYLNTNKNKLIFQPWKK